MALFRPLFFIFIFSFQLSAQKALLFESGKIKDVAAYASYYLDETGVKSIEEVSASNGEVNFKQFEAAVPNFGVTKSVLWCKILLLAPSKSGWALQFSNPSIEEITFYQTGLPKTSYGISMPKPKGSSLYGSLIYKPQLPVGDTTVVYIKMTDVLPLYFSMKAGEDYLLLEQERGGNFIHGLYFGIMILVILYNLFLFITNRDRVYVYYVFYMLFSGFFVAFFVGYISVFPSWFLAFVIRVPSFIPAVFGFFSLLFSIRFLDTHHHFSSRVNRFIYFFSFTVFLSVLFSLFGFRHFSVELIQFFGLILALTCLTIGVIVLRKGYGPAKYYIIGFGAYMIGILILILGDVFGYTGSNFARYSVEIGSAIEAIMLSFALGDKLNSANKERQLAQASALETAKENERLVMEQNIVLEKRVKERTHEISLQKEIIEEKNKDILSSIEYAKRIQRALLASDKFLSDKLKEHFVLYLPKDIVSGDFYWAQEIRKNNKTYFLICIADCTGHGVPGAFMSLLNINFLNEAVSDRNLLQPDEILNTVRDNIVKALNSHNDGVEGKDGMDCALCLFDFSALQLYFSCANNPIWVYRNGAIIESEVDKFPVGLHNDIVLPFRLHKFELLPGDIVYGFTDGYADQFGGPSGKKFKYKQLKELIQQNAHLPLLNQKRIFEERITSWKGSLEQVDDILLIAIKV